MNIGFDAKRAFHNNTGLGNYSRTLLNSLNEYFPENEYYLYNPKPSNKFKLIGSHLHQILPQKTMNKFFNAAWRSKSVVKEFSQNNIDIYHGLSHEIPIGIAKSKTKSVVTIHDLIYLRYPNQFRLLDRIIYDFKFRYACKNANHIIAISEQTKQDIILYYKMPEKNISVCYQSCDPAFSIQANEIDKKYLQDQFDLPVSFFLYVGSIIERKNLLNICKALKALEDIIDIPLVVIGDGKKYKEEVKNYLKANQIVNKVIFLSENKLAKKMNIERPDKFLPVLYQMATALIYPSIFEGFGIPVLEALCSQLPVITSNISSLPEAGGPGSIYIDPYNPEEIAEAMKSVFFKQIDLQKMKELGTLHAANFSRKECAQQIINVYNRL